MTGDIAWGPTGEAVYDRTYSRTKPDGTRETWPETVERVARGNISLVHGEPETWPERVRDEFTDLTESMKRFEILPAGRHLWASGVKGRQYLFNCHVAGWSSLAEHVEFVLMRLAEGGGVGANYSTRYLAPLGSPVTPVRVHVVCDPSHPDYEALRAAGIISEEYAPDWPGTFEVEDTREGWASAVIDLIETAYNPETKHENRVYDVSRVRWSGARLKTMGGTASGPEPLAQALRSIGYVLTSAYGRVTNENLRMVPAGRRSVKAKTSHIDYAEHSLTPLEAMEIDHAIAQAIVAGGTRRSARMSIVRWDDPYVMEFINCKADKASHWSTNISVEIDDEFLTLLNGKHHGAMKVYRAIVTGMLTNGEPGIWNSTLSNQGEPNQVVATNPCGEIALQAWENCNLGHVNMDAFIDADGNVDMPKLSRAHVLMTRFLIRATYGDVVDSKQLATLRRNRRIGVGHFGVQGYLVKQGLRFSDIADYESPAYAALSSELRHLSWIVDSACQAYCHELRIPVPVKKRTVAPTGTIAKMPGRTEGIHPIYARHFLRRVRFSTTDPHQVAQVEALKAEGYHVEPDECAANTQVVTFITEDQLVAEVRDAGLSVDLVESADELSLGEMLAFQRAYQTHWADNAVSFTVNVPGDANQRSMMAAGYDVPEPEPERVNEVMSELLPFLPDLKGTTLMVDGTRPQAPYERVSESWFKMHAASGVKVTVDASYDEDCASGACPIK